MRTFLKHTSVITLLSFWATLCTPLTPAWAVSDPIGFASGTPGGFSVKCSDQGTGKSQNCDPCKKFCQFLDGKGISGSSTWNTTDDALCSSVGSATNNGNTTMPTPNPSYGSCSVNVPDQVVSALSSSSRWQGSNGDVCSEAQSVKDMCTFHNSQVQVQCQAVNAIGGGSNGGPIAANTTLMAFDFVIAATCTAAALAPNLALGGVNVLAHACTIGAMAEGSAELIVTMSMLSGKVQDYISAGLGGLGAVGGAAGLAAQLQAKQAKNAAKRSAEEPLSNDSGSDSTVTEAENRTSHSATKVEKEAKQIEDSKAQDAKKAAFITAAIFAALGAIRLANIIQMNSSLSNACGSVDSLLGSTPPVTSTSSASASGTSTTGYTPGGGSGGSSTSSGGGSGGGTGNGAITSQDQYNAVNKCVGQGGTFSACLSAATQGSLGADANLLGNSPEAQLALPNHLGDLPAVAQKALQGGAGAAMGSMLPSGSGDVGAAIAGIAQAAQEDAAKLASGMGVSSGVAYVGGGNGGGGGKSESNPFSSLFGGGTAGSFGAAQGAAVASYGNLPQATDIWHANTQMNLFEIVSDKIGKVATRVK